MLANALTIFKNNGLYMHYSMQVFAFKYIYNDKVIK